MGIGNRESAIGGAYARNSEVHARSSDFRFPIPGFRSCARGFTLIELVAVVALIGIALSVVSLSFSKSMNSAKVQAASRDLVAALRYTRGQAIVKGQQTALDLDMQNNTLDRKSVV